jgi:hypothetical protein
VKGSDQIAEEELLRLCIAEEKRRRQETLVWRMRLLMALVALTMLGSALAPKPWCLALLLLMLAEIAIFGGIAVQGVEMRARLTKRENRSWYRTVMLLGLLPRKEGLL